VTYLGYLKSLSTPVHHKWLLVASWVVLFTCLVCSLFFTYFHAHYGHFFRAREYCEAVKKRYETEIAEIGYMNFENLQTKAEIDAFVNPRKAAIQKSTENAKWNERREKRYQHAWIWTGKIARGAFIVGLGLLVAFAIKNV
jgi:hypothetical protein